MYLKVIGWNVWIGFICYRITGDGFFDHCDESHYSLKNDFFTVRARDELFKKGMCSMELTLVPLESE
jgi:hypothetical protein